jgi:hypothetical protein
MTNNLKQQILFKTLKSFDVHPVTYIKLYLVFCKKANDQIYKTIDSKYLNGKELSSEGLRIIESVDKLFISQKRIDPRASEPDFTKKLTTFNSIFPTGKLPSNSIARTTIPMLKKKFERFFKLYQYDWNTILKATMLYVNEYEAKNYEKMRTSGHFVIKVVSGETYCDLAEYCEKIIEGTEVNQNVNVKRSNGKIF